MMMPRSSFLLLAALTFLSCGAGALAAVDSPLAIPPPPATSTPPAAPHWAYDQPDEWPGTCATGRQQSPIAIDPTAVRFNNRLSPLVFHGGCSLSDYDVTVLNNGHTLMMSLKATSPVTMSPCYLVDPTIVPPPNGGIGMYHFLQLHIHSPPEHVHDRDAEAEVHLVFQDSQQRLLVVGVQLEAVAPPRRGHTAPPSDVFLSVLVPKKKRAVDFPDAVGEAVTVASPVGRLSDLLPSTSSYFAYRGSLTTPPCTEGVQWILLSRPSRILAERIKVFRAILRNTTLQEAEADRAAEAAGAAGSGDVERKVKPIMENARPVQPLNGRHIQYFEDPNATSVDASDRVDGTTASYIHGFTMLAICVVIGTFGVVTMRRISNSNDSFEAVAPAEAEAAPTTSSAAKGIANYGATSASH